MRACEAIYRLVSLLGIGEGEGLRDGKTEQSPNGETSKEERRVFELRRGGLMQCIMACGFLFCSRAGGTL